MPRHPEDFVRESPVSVSYSFTDIVEGTGTIIYYGFSHREVTTNSYALTTRALRSQWTSTSIAAGNNNGAEKKLDLDFDVTLNIPQTIKGKCNIMMTLGGLTSAAVSPDIYAIARVRKWDGTTETEIASAQSDTVDIAPSAPPETVSQPVTFQVTIPETHYASGETIRITIELWSDSFGGTVGAFVGFGHDPADRNDTLNTLGNQVIEDAHSTVMEVHIPFVPEYL